MLEFADGLLGYARYRRFELFTGSDRKELLEKNLKDMPADWYYHNTTISYDRNDHGHRCKNIKDVDLDNYILTIGCSHTEGIGLRLEDTYSYILSKKLNTDYYNLAIGGSGIDLMMYNLLTWFGLIQKQPKLVVVQWPEKNRFLTKLRRDDQQIVPIGPWRSERELTDFMIVGDDNNFFHTRQLLSYQLLKNFIKVPLVNVKMYSSDPIEGVHMKYLDLSRDMVHYGKDTHENLAQEIVNYLR
jgi:hypothetical protein